MKMLKISKRLLLVLSLIYMYLPVMLFLFGWVNTLTACLIAMAIIFGMVRLYHIFCSDNEAGNYLEISVVNLICIILFIMLMTYLSGWGRFTSQTGDWFKHNGVMADLTNKDWPVYYTKHEKAMLTYYIGQYMTPALVGKLFDSFRVTEIANYIWSTIGVVLISLNMMRVLKIKNQAMQFLSVVILFIFSPPMLLGQKLTEFFAPEFHDMLAGNSMMHNHFFVIYNDIMLQYSANIILLRWVFIQIIVCWLIMTWFFENYEKVETYVTLLLPALFYGSFSFIGLLFLAFGLAVYYVFVHKNNIAGYLKRLFSFENIYVSLYLGGPFFAYFYGNVSGDKPSFMKFHVTDFGDGFIYYVLFVITMVGFYGVCLLIYNRKNAFLWVNLLFLVILPFLKMGLYNDLVMRASIPGLFAIMLFVIKFFRDYQEAEIDRNSVIAPLVAAFLSIFLLAGCFNFFGEITSSVFDDDIWTLADETSYGTMEEMADRTNPDNRLDDTYNYYTYDLDDDVFYNYFARKKVE